MTDIERFLTIGVPAALGGWSLADYVWTGDHLAMLCAQFGLFICMFGIYMRGLIRVASSEDEDLST